MSIKLHERDRNIVKYRAAIIHRDMRYGSWRAVTESVGQLYPSERLYALELLEKGHLEGCSKEQLKRLENIIRSSSLLQCQT